MFTKKAHKKGVMVVAVIAMATLLMSSTGFAYSFGGIGTVAVSADSGWTIKSKIKDTAKQTHDGEDTDAWYVKVTDEEMIRKPSVRLYGNTEVSACSDQKKVGVGTYAGTGSIAIKNRVYFAQVKPNALQVNDSCNMTFCIDAD